MSLRQAKNNVKVEGILSEVDLDYTTFKKAGKDVEAIGGSIKVKVSQKINKNDPTPTELEIPIHMFSAKYTNAGKENPAYQSIERVKDNLTSIAAAGGETGADRVRITNGDLRMNEYYNQNGALVAFPRINASFVTKVKAEDCVQTADFEAEVVIGKIVDEVDKEGIETGRLAITGIIVQYGGKADVFTFYITRPDIISAFKQAYNEGDTVPLSGKLNFSSKTETVLEQVEIGDPVEKTRTINVSELVISGAKAALDGDFAFDVSELSAALKERDANLSKLKEKASSTASERKAPAETKGKVDLGF